MTVYNDGDALSDWECHELEDIEHYLELSDPRLAAFYSSDDPTPFSVLAVNLVAGETVLALTAVTALTACVAGTIVGLVTLGTSLWVRSWSVRR